MCELVDTPRSLAAWLCFKHGAFGELVSLEARPLDYETKYHPRDFAGDHLVCSVLSKFSDFDIGVDRTEVAFSKWKEAEARCKRTNDLFRKRWDGDYSDNAMFSPQVEHILHIARTKIRDLLKEVDYDYIRSQCKFGPGSDLSTARDNTSTYHKFGSDGACTPWIIPLYDDIFSNEDSDFRGEFVHRATLVRSSRLSFVPKNAKTNRAICVEPRWNVFLQLGIGRLIQKRLLRVGIDIRSQVNNQEAAQRAYADGLATIDLSSASDNISTNLVLDLFSWAPDDWLELLLRSRCPSTTYKGETIRLEKISSMGNGYTFPLETLIFYAISFAAMVVAGDSKRIAKDLWVYGDDIIVPASSAPLLMQALECLGFLPNKKKTFYSGDFYESCGKDFYKGRNVRPFFIKKKVRSVLDGFTVANQISAYARSMVSDPRFADRKVWNLREHVIRRIPKHLRCFGPPEAGNGAIHSTFDVSRPQRASSFRHYAGWEGYLIKCFVAQPTKKLGWNPQGHLYSKLSDDIDSGQTVTTRSDVRWRRKVVCVPTYTDVMLI
jgi:hypothetical protein